MAIINKTLNLEIEKRQAKINALYESNLEWTEEMSNIEDAITLEINELVKARIIWENHPQNYSDSFTDLNCQ